MFEELKEWYKLTSLTSDIEGKLQQRQKIINKFASTKNIVWLLDCLKLFLGKPCANFSFLNNFINAFNRNSIYKLGEKSYLEQRIIAGAILHDYFFLNPTKEKIVIAIACKSALFKVNKAEIIHKDIIETIQNYLYTQSEESRIFKVGLQLPGIDLVPKPTSATLGEITNITNNLNNTINSLKATLEKVINNYENRILRLEEESDIHWWLFNGNSITLELSYDKMDPEAGAFLMGRELSQLTKLIPGPLAAEEFLRKMVDQVYGLKPYESTIEKLVSSTKHFPDIHDIIQKNEFGNICPLHCAFEISKEHAVHMWPKKFESECNLSLSTKLSLYEIAYQSYDEHQLIKTKELLK